MTDAERLAALAWYRAAQRLMAQGIEVVVPLEDGDYPLRARDSRNGMNGPFTFWNGLSKKRLAQILAAREEGRKRFGQPVPSQKATRPGG